MGFKPQGHYDVNLLDIYRITWAGKFLCNNIKIASQYAALEHRIDKSLNLQNNLTTIESNIRDSNRKEMINLTIGILLAEA
jgi:hypothetical protein